MKQFLWGANPVYPKVDILSTPPKDRSVVHSTNHCFDIITVSQWDLIFQSFFGVAETESWDTTDFRRTDYGILGPLRSHPSLPGGPGEVVVYLGSEFRSFQMIH